LKLEAALTLNQNLILKIVSNKAIMKKAILSFAVIVFSSFLFEAAAEPLHQITWNDLIPAHLVKEDYLKDLTDEQKDLVMWFINAYEFLPKRSENTDESWKELDDAMPTLKKHGVDIAKVMQKRREIQTAVVKELNGKRVRLPGYILPLEMSESKVIEFLLVPYVGACIHVPPPPPNQIVFVKTDAKKGYASKQLYEPVWVTGIISVQSMVKDLFLVDGSAGVEIGYNMQANQIEPYE
jgi:hypothetical protein